MSGMSDFAAKAVLNLATGQLAAPTLPSLWLALFTTAPTSDSGAGVVEVSGGSYARIQVAGPATTTAGTTTSSPTVTIGGGVPAWITQNGQTGAGFSVYDKTTGLIVGTISSVGGTTITLTANATNAITSGDVVTISAFAGATGSGPSTATLNGLISFVQSTAGWGNVNSFGLYDAVTSGNLWVWDYMGGFNWLPCTVSSASPGVITTKAHGMSNGDNFVFSVEYGGTAPTFSAGNFTGVLTAASVTTDTLVVTGVNTSATGDGMIRKITVQSIPINVTASFASSTIVVSGA
jgi:hypothetical protein